MMLATLQNTAGVSGYTSGAVAPQAANISSSCTYLLNAGKATLNNGTALAARAVTTVASLCGYLATTAAAVVKASPILGAGGVAAAATAGPALVAVAVSVIANGTQICKVVGSQDLYFLNSKRENCLSNLCSRLTSRAKGCALGFALIFGSCAVTMPLFLYSGLLTATTMAAMAGGYTLGAAATTQLFDAFDRTLVKCVLNTIDSRLAELRKPHMPKGTTKAE